MSPCPQWLRSILREAGGAITFERFMREALYHPDHGYYAARISAVGRAGDFSTSATLSPSFAEALARWAIHRAKEDFPDGGFALVEIGAGGGQLATDFREAWQHLGGPSADYWAVETSPALRASLSAVPGLRLAGSVEEALGPTAGRALIFSNELPDAFPARQLVWTDHDWHEIALRLTPDHALEEVRLPLTDAVDAEAPAEAREGMRLFIHPSYHQWLDREFVAWRAGRMLTIDYGRNWPASECRAYRAQERREGNDVFADAGTQDLTCDVNFRDLRRWGEGLGWQTVTVESQADWLARWLPELTERQSRDQALAFLAHPFGAGGAFLTLEQRAPVRHAQ